MMDMLFKVFRALALLGAANATPIVVARLLRERFSAPIDCGWVLPDGERLFGDHKTWRGLTVGIAMCTVISLLFDLTASFGAAFGFVSLLGDALSSAAKRRLHLRPGTERVGLDQIGEVALPIAVFATPLSLDAIDIVIVFLLFVALGLATTHFRHRRRAV